MNDLTRIIRQRRQLNADRAAGRIDEAEYRARLRDLLDDTALGSVADPSSSASTLQTPGRHRDRGLSPVLPNEMIDEYQVEECVGAGSYGIVWRAFSEAENRHVAIKLLPSALSCDATEMSRVRECFEKVHHLHHQYICPVYRLARHERLGYYLVMQYVEGMPIDEWHGPEASLVEHRRIVMRLLGMAASALDYAHSKGVVHRDVKPGNMLCAFDGTELQLVDFGLADQIHTSLSRVSGERAPIIGTPAYMSPEACDGRPQDGRSDQYSLACVAYQLLSRRIPFEGQAWLVLNCHRNRSPEPISELSSAANSVLRRALAKSRSERFESCTQFVHSLSCVTDDVPPADIKTKPVPMTGWQLSSFSLEGLEVALLRFAPNTGQLFVVGRNGDIWAGSATGDEWKKLRDSESTVAVRSATLTPEGGFVLLGELTQILVADAQTGRIISRVQIEPSELRHLASESATTALCCTEDNRILSIELATGRTVRQIRPVVTGLRSCHVSPDRRARVECGTGGVVIKTARRPFGSRATRVPGFDDGTARVVFSADSKMLALRHRLGFIEVRFLSDLANYISVVDDERPLMHAAFIVGTYRIAATTDDSRLSLYDACTGRLDKRVELPATPSRWCISPTGEVALTDRTGRLWRRRGVI